MSGTPVALGFSELARLPRRRLRRLFAAGTAPDPAALAGWEFRGLAPLFGTSFLVRFVKGFEGDDGYNVLAPGRHWVRWRVGGRVLRHSWFLLRRLDHALEMDYGSSRRNPRLWPGRLFRDFLVHPYGDDRDLLLGMAYVRLGRLLPVGFFVLERDRPVKDDA